MAMDGCRSMERFQVCGNVLKLTPKFDPRYQSRAGMELINIVSSLASEGQDPEVILDITDAEAFPSMMFGILCEARDLTDKAGKRLKIRLKKSTYDRLCGLGLERVFTHTPAHGGPDGLELVAERDEAAAPKQGE